MLTWEKSPWGSFSLWSIGSQPYIQSAIAKGENHRDLGSLRKREHSGHRAAQSDRLDSSPGVTLHYQWPWWVPYCLGNSLLFPYFLFCFLFIICFILQGSLWGVNEGVLEYVASKDGRHPWQGHPLFLRAREQLCWGLYLFPHPLFSLRIW